MTTVFIAGSRNIKRLDSQVTERIDKIISSNLNIVVGDADGSDTSIQSYLFEHGAKNIVVYCSGSQPRNNIGDWPIQCVDSGHTPGSRAFFTAKDVEMAEVAEYGLMIWDAMSTGTLSNIIELLNRKKKSVVFINKNKEFKTITEVSDLEDLVMCMSLHAQNKADQKIRLHDKIKMLKNEQFQMF